MLSCVFFSLWGLFFLAAGGARGRIWGVNIKKAKRVSQAEKQTLVPSSIHPAQKNQQ
jgi:hypothetical protein